MAEDATGAQERLISTYYDTQTLALYKRGLTLRVREQGDRLTQTVKASGSTAAADMLSRGEWEDALTENRPDPDAPQSGRHLPVEARADLRPLFVTEVTRTVADIEPCAGTRIEAAIDEGEVRHIEDGAAEPISEVELELKSGEPAALYDIALRLLEVAAIRIERRSKSERGYRLVLGGGNAAPIHAEPVTLDRDMPVETVMQRIGRSCLMQLIGNEAAVLSGDAEGVHQMRVATRRLRSAISAAKNMLAIEDRRWIAGELAWLAGALGLARNLDVFARELLPATRTGLPDQPGWEELAATLDGLRGEAYDHVKETVLAKRYTTAMLRLLRWFEGCGWREKQTPEQSAFAASPIGEVAARVVERRWRKMRRRSKRFSKRTSPERHKLRIAVKKLRYTTELFGSLFDDSHLQSFVRKLKRLQNGLGYANDVRVAHEFVVDLFARTKPRSAAGSAWVSLLQWHDLTLAARERNLRKHVRRLTRAAPFWCD